MDMSHSLLLVVDMTRAHLDFDFNYLPIDEGDAKRLLDTVSTKVMPIFRERNLPVAFVTTAHKINPLTGESMAVANPFWKYQMEHQSVPGVGRKRKPINVEGSPAEKIMPPLEVREHDIVVKKESYNPFLGTHLETYLRIMEIETIFIVGINTNNCVLCTAFEASNRDFMVVLVDDCCASMNGPEYHEMALKMVRTSLGFTVKSGEVANLLDGKTELSSLL